LICSTISCEIFLILIRIKRDTTINVHRLRCKVPRCYYYQISIKTEFSRQIFDKYSNIKFQEHQSSGSRVVPCGRATGRKNVQTDRETDGRTDMTKVVVIFRNFGNVPIKHSII